MLSWQQVWETEFLSNSAGQWTLALIVFLVTFTVLPLIKGYVSARRRKWLEARRELPLAIEVATLLIERTSRVFLWAAALCVGARFLSLSPQVSRALDVIIVVCSWMQVGIWAVAAVRFALKRRQKTSGADAAISSSLTIVMFVTHLMVWAIVVLLALGNLGVNITALVAGLGIGGIAIALAVQTVLGDLLASLSIAFDKPFRVGDTLGIDDYIGTVEDIGIKSTRLRSVSGEQLIISNADILKSRVRNLGRMPEQRALLTLSIDYETPNDKLDLVAGLVEEAVQTRPNTRFQYCALKNFTFMALEFEVAYFVKQPRGQDYLHTVDAVNRSIHAALHEQDIRFAYPSRTAFQPPRTQPETAQSAVSRPVRSEPIS